MAEKMIMRLLESRYAQIAIVLGLAFVLGYWVGNDEWKMLALAFGPIVFLAVALRRKWFFALAMAAGLAAETVMVSGNLIGVPQLRIPRVLVVVALVHVGRSLFHDKMKDAWVRWTAMDSAVAVYFVVSTIGAIGMGEEAAYLWEHVVVGPVALYLAGRSVLFDEETVNAITQAAFWAGTLLALSVVIDSVTGTANFVSVSRGYAWTESQSAIFRPGGLIGQPVRAGTLCALAFAWMPMVLPRIKRFRALYYIGFATQLAAIAVTFTRAAWMGTGLVILIYAGARYGLKSSVFIGSFAAGVAAWLVSSFENTVRFTRAVLRPDTIAYRFSLWSYAVSPFESGSPKDLIIGAGLYATRHPDFAGAYALVLSGTHNAYLTSLLEHGVVGFLAYLGMLMSPLVLGVRSLVMRRVDSSVALTMIGTSVLILIASVSSELVRQYNVPAVYLLSAGVLISIALRSAASDAS